MIPSLSILNILSIDTLSKISISRTNSNIFEVGWNHVVGPVTSYKWTYVAPTSGLK